MCKIQLTKKKTISVGRGARIWIHPATGKLAMWVSYTYEKKTFQVILFDRYLLMSEQVN